MGWALFFIFFIIIFLASKNLNLSVEEVSEPTLEQKLLKMYNEGKLERYRNDDDTYQYYAKPKPKAGITCWRGGGVGRRGYRGKR